MKVYIAGPMTLGNASLNAMQGIATADALWRNGFIPYCPHLTHFWHRYYPHTWEEWLIYDEQWLLVCDAVLRLPGPSKGADREVRFAEKNGIPIFYNLVDLVNWRDGKIQEEIK